MRLSIRQRFLILLALLLIFPFLMYRMALDFNRKLLEQQIVQQSQTVQNLAAILENRPDLWALQIFKGDPTRQLRHLDLNNAGIWLFNRNGTTTYVVGHLPKEEAVTAYDDFFARIGQWTIRQIHALFPHTLPYLIPYDANPEKTLIQQVLKGETAQRFRFDAKGRPLSLMSATPLIVNGKQLGGIVVEERVESLFGPQLQNFYHVVGIATSLLVLLMMAFAFYGLTLSGRIRRLQLDVSRAFDPARYRIGAFPDTRKPNWQQDEVDNLRHSIFEMLQHIRQYETFLKALPKALRHELHNPLNRLSMSLQRIEETGRTEPYIEHARHGVTQLQRIITALGEAGSIEQSVLSETPHTYRVSEMLHALAEALQEHYGDKLKITLQLSDAASVCGDGFLLEQALDKLISNAFDFHQGKAPVQFEAIQQNNVVDIRVINRGTLPETLSPEQLFTGMTSVRPKTSSTPHLGLGLYIVRLVAQFHGGEAYIRQEGNTVIAGLKLPLTPCDQV
ncbi:Signal transduction histidine kinase [Sulfurivirga caldicuralii]|uniref:histidine kinase n=2 Tax=Sulfurivirga caldicuralii TaxID=364032 RepID=A0A1N6FAV4_9GAMM|nr:Signal transduction histidine kinase [Sulfurivirga caldicuralii]